MPSPFRMAAVAALFLPALVESARSQELAPPGSGVSIFKVIIESGDSHTVRYYVKGGSPRLQALVRRVEWAENELSVIEQLQGLKLDTVVNERRIAAFRTSLLTDPFYPGGVIPLPIGPGNGGEYESSLQRALGKQLAWEATPQAALQMIGFLERLQTEFDGHLKALPPQEMKPAQGLVDALRPRLAAVPRFDAPPSRPEPVQPGRMLAFPPITQEQLGTRRPVAAPVAVRAAVEVEWGGTWYAAEVLRVGGGSTLIHYTGWSSSWDEWVPAGRIRRAGSITGLRR